MERDGAPGDSRLAVALQRDELAALTRATRHVQHSVAMALNNRAQRRLPLLWRARYRATDASRQKFRERARGGVFPAEIALSDFNSILNL